jgi:2-iminobutanoate/2-iminopropanoate deaminase
MPRNVILTANAPAPPPTYSQAIKAAGLIFVSGTAPADPDTGQLIAGDAAEQTAQCLRNIAAILAAAGSSPEKAVSATIILAEPEDFAAVNQEWVKWFPTNPPARQGAKLPVAMPGLRVSIAMIAMA